MAKQHKMVMPEVSTEMVLDTAEQVKAKKFKAKVNMDVTGVAHLRQGEDFEMSADMQAHFDKKWGKEKQAHLFEEVK